MVNIVNQSTLGGGFRHFAGLNPTNPGDGGSQAQASCRVFHIPATNAAAIFRGDIVVSSSAAIGVQGAADMSYNIAPPNAAAASVLIGNGGGTGLGNPAMSGNATRWVPGDTTSVILGAVVGFGPITLFQAKNGFQLIPASTEAWITVETDPAMEFNITMPTVPGATFPLILQSGIDVQANAAQQQTRFGISGVSLNAATIATTSTLPLRLLNSGDQIGNDTTAVGFIARVQFNLTRHYKGGAAFVAE